MIGYLSGDIIKKIDKNQVILMADSVGYVVRLLKIEFDYYAEDSENFGTAHLYIKNIVAENKNDLYGFKDYENIEMFNDLISVSGIGPNTAMLILNDMSISEIKKAIINDDLKHFIFVKGVGMKAAEKLAEKLQKKYIGENNE